jgi:hypothetical protein
MPAASDLTEAVKSAVVHLARTLDELEVLLLLNRGRTQTWTPEQVAQALVMTEKCAADQLALMQGRGLAVRAEGAAGYRYVEGTAHEAEVALIAETYRARRLTLVNYVATGALDRLQSFAEGFRFRRKGKP